MGIELTLRKRLLLDFKMCRFAPSIIKLCKSLPKKEPWLQVLEHINTE